MKNIITNLIKFGTGAYVGFMDGTNNSLSPEVKYSLLATPSVLQCLTDTSCLYAGKKIFEYADKHPKIVEELIKKNSKDDIEEIVNRMKYKYVSGKVKNLKVENSYGFVLENSCKTALKTGVGYLIGYVTGSCLK